MPTDKERMDWLCERVSYLEHANAAGVICSRVPRGCYWPQSTDPALNPCGTAIEDYAGMELQDYIDAMIALEKA